MNDVKYDVFRRFFHTGNFLADNNFYRIVFQQKDLKNRIHPGNFQ